MSWRKNFNVIDHSTSRIEFFVLVLREIITFNVVSDLERTLSRRLKPREQFDQSGFSCSVHSDQCDTISAFEDEIDITEHSFCAIGLGETFSFHNRASAGLGLRKLKVNGGLFLRHF